MAAAAQQVVTLPPVGTLENSIMMNGAGATMAGDETFALNPRYGAQSSANLELSGRGFSGDQTFLHVDFINIAKLLASENNVGANMGALGAPRDASKNTLHDLNALALTGLATDFAFHRALP
jgi:hypothetical protein